MEKRRFSIKKVIVLVAISAFGVHASAATGYLCAKMSGDAQRAGSAQGVIYKSWPFTYVGIHATSIRSRCATGNLIYTNSLGKRVSVPFKSCNKATYSKKYLSAPNPNVQVNGYCYAMTLCAICGAIPPSPPSK